MNKFLALVGIVFLLSGCGTSTLLQTTIDHVIEMHQQSSIAHLKKLMRKLYLRNPNELTKHAYTKTQIEAKIFNKTNYLPTLKILNNSRSVDSVYLAFNEEYKGDRVFALIYGLHSMLMDAYSNKNHFIFTDSLTAQKFYNLARNFEVINWKLNYDKKTNNKPYLYSNALKNEPVYNRSFERLFGKLIAEQDMMAKTVEISNSQAVKSIVINITSGLLLPV